MTKNYSSIPEEMKARNQWVNYAMMDKKKVPLNHKTRKACNVSKDENQFSFEEAVAAENKYDGVGISLGKGLIGIDIDNCIDENGNLSEEDNYVLNNVNSYAERSVSKNGIHIYALGNINLSKNRESIPFNG